jgi:hypothetical protein
MEDRMITAKRSVGVVLIAILLFSLACQIASSPSASNPSAPSIVGKWSGLFQGEAVTMEFTDRGTCTVTSNGQTAECTYILDMSSKPFKLDVAFKGQGILLTVFELINATTLKMENSDVDQPRPKALDDNSAVFTKK